LSVSINAVVLYRAQLVLGWVNLSRANEPSHYVISTNPGCISLAILLEVGTMSTAKSFD